MRQYFVVGFLLLAGCGSIYQPSKLGYHQYTIDSTYRPDSLLQAYLHPFRDSMQKEMNEVVGTTELRLGSSRPYSSLGNFMADAFLQQAKEKYDSTADLSMISFGNFRRPSIEVGNITKSIIFELMPFDNSMVLIKAKGTLIKRYLEEMMSEGGGLAGAELWFKGKTLQQVYIKGKNIDSSGIYTLVSFDYAASNPSKSWFFSQSVRIDCNYLIREALLQYVKELRKVDPSNTNITERRMHFNE